MKKRNLNSVIVKTVVFKGNKFLLLKRTDYKNYAVGEWDLPGGGLEKGESPEMGARREIMEETGIKAKIIMPYNTNYVYNDAEKIYMVSIHHIAEYKSGKIKPSKEHELVEWCDANHIPRSITPWVKETVCKAIKIRNAIKKIKKGN